MSDFDCSCCKWNFRIHSFWACGCLEIFGCKKKHPFNPVHPHVPSSLSTSLSSPDTLPPTLITDSPFPNMLRYRQVWGYREWDAGRRSIGVRVWWFAIGPGGLGLGFKYGDRRFFFRFPGCSKWLYCRIGTMMTTLSDPPLTTYWLNHVPRYQDCTAGQCGALQTVRSGPLWALQMAKKNAV